MLCTHNLQLTSAIRCCKSTKLARVSRCTCILLMVENWIRRRWVLMNR